MKNYIQFLQNYSKFGSQLKYRSAQLFLQALGKNQSKTNCELDQSLLMANIVDMFIAQTEDFFMFLKALNISDYLATNVREQMLKIFIQDSDNNVNPIYQELESIHSPKQLCQYLRLLDPEQILETANETETEISEKLSCIIVVIKTAIENRQKKTLLTFHNKMKHGSLIYYNPLPQNSIEFINVNKENKITTSGELHVNYEFARTLVSNMAKTVDITQWLIDYLQEAINYKISSYPNNPKIEPLKLSEKEIKEIKKCIANPYI